MRAPPPCAGEEQLRQTLLGEAAPRPPPASVYSGLPPSAALKEKNDELRHVRRHLPPPPSLPPSFARGRPSPRLGAQAIETIAEAYWEIIGETARRRPRHMVRIGKRVATTASLLALWRWNRALPGWRPRRQYGMLNQALRLITVTVAECRALLDEDDCQKGTACRMMLDNFDDGVDAVDEMDDDVSAR